MKPVIKASRTLAVCDLCHSRKVRCDRKNTCGNCEDGNVPCTRLRRPRHAKTRISHTNPQETQSQRPQVFDKSSLNAQMPLQATQPISRTLMEDNLASYSENSKTRPGPVLNIPHYDAQAIILLQLKNTNGLENDRRHILESALSTATHFSDTLEAPLQNCHDGDLGEQGYKIPSIELFTWMLRDIKGDRFGPFVKDYFRYISEASAKEMCLFLLHVENINFKSAETAIYTVCVNSMVYKFLTCVINTESDPEIAHELRHNALQYRSTAKVALQMIPLVTSPSLKLLQAILSGVFFHQGTGDIKLCYELTRAACRICIDLGLHETLRTGGHLNEEEYYCFAWCFMLDKSYAFKLGHSKSSLDIDFGPDSIPNAHPMAEDLLLNLDLAKVQAAVLPHLESRFSGDCTANFSRIGKDTLTRMRRIQERIEMIAPSSPLWKGLDAQSEVSVLKFACHSVSTIILHLLQDCQASPLETRDSYLESARQGLSSLMSMSLSAEKQSAVAFLHWTLLFYPISAYFVLFCNVVATSNIADFNLLKATVDCLAWGEAKSAPIAQIRSVLQYFVHLSRGVFKGKTTIPGALGDFQYQVQPQPSQFLSSLNSFPSSWNSDCERIQSHSDEVENCPETFFYSLQGLGSPDHDIFDFLENQFENA